MHMVFATITCYNIGMETIVAKKHKYLKSRHQSYYVRVPVPEEIQSIIGKCEITRSLKTRNKQEGELRWHNVVGPMLRKFSEIKAQVNKCTGVHLNDFDPVFTAKGWLYQKLQALHENDLKQFAAGEREQRIDDLRYELPYYKAAFLNTMLLTCKWRLTPF